MKSLYFLFAVIIMLFISCEKEEVNPTNFIGTYEGIFLSEDMEKSLKRTGPVTLILKDNGYECIGNPNLVPAGGEGTFVKKEGKLVFNSEGVWQRVNLEMVLQGEFSYSYDGKNLKLWRESNTTLLKYELTRN